MHDSNEASDDDLRPEYDFDYSKATPNRFVASTKHGKRETVRWVIALVALGVLMFGLRSYTAPREAPLPALLPSTPAAEQQALLAAIKAHPNPPITVDALPRLGTDARGLKILLSEMTFSGFGLVGKYGITLAPSKDPVRDVTTARLEIAGDPPRVVRRWIETNQGYSE